MLFTNRSDIYAYIHHTYNIAFSDIWSLLAGKDTNAVILLVGFFVVFAANTFVDAAIFHFHNSVL